MDDAPASRPENESATRVEAERAVRCARCGASLTREREAFELFGRHAHTFMNPSGVVFEIALFGEVPGATVRGVPDAETTWFPGTAWIYAHCAGCDGHVGWQYVWIDGARERQRFFGLIADCIVRAG